MPKRTIDFVDQVNFLAPAGTLDRLIAVAYYRGEGRKFASSARDFMERGLREFVAGLSDKERKRYEEILQNVRITRNSSG